VSCVCGAMPRGFQLQFLVDSGVLERQPHADVCRSTDLKADPDDRLYVWNRSQMDIAYERLDPSTQRLAGFIFTSTSKPPSLVAVMRQGLCLGPFTSLCATSHLLRRWLVDM